MGREADPGDISERHWRLLLGVGVVAGLWLTRRGLVTDSPNGLDVYGHVVRTDAALRLFADGRLDGWFPSLGSGYRLFAVNGPGLAVLSATVKLLSLGTVSTARSLAILGALSIAALPPAVAVLSRELGSNRLAAGFHGLLSLAASYGGGGGLVGLYGTGLVPQSLAVPVLFVALTLVLRVVRHGTRTRMALAAAVIAALALLHPISVLILAPFAIVLGAIVWTRGPTARIARLPLVAAWAAGLSAFWLVPALHARGLRGGVVSWDVPPLPTRLSDIARGDTLFPSVLAAAVALAVAMTLGQAWLDPSRWRRLVGPAVGIGFLVVAHHLEGRQLGPYEIVVQFPTRGLVVAGILALQPLAELIADGLRLARRHTAAAAMGVAVALAWLFPGLLDQRLDPAQVASPPVPALASAADELDGAVPAMGRHLLVRPAVGDSLGTAVPERWLAATSGTNSAHLYFWEATRENTAGILASELLVNRDAAGGIETIRRLGITHVVVTSDDQAAALDAVDGFRRTWQDGHLHIYEVEAAANAPPPGALLQPDGWVPATDYAAFRARPEVRTPEHLQWRVVVGGNQPRWVVAAVAFDPAWDVTVDGRSVRTERSADGLVRFAVPAGRHRVDLRFTAGRLDPLGLALTILAAALLAAALTGRWPDLGTSPFVVGARRLASRPGLEP